MLKKNAWKGKQFRKYDIVSPVPRLFGGKRQPYLSFLQEVREKLVALGFEEMSGSIVENEFWNYDALFQPQFHAAREWTSTYYIKNKLKQEAIDKKIVENVKQQHEKSWKYNWSLEHAMRLILRPQGTVLSARQLPKAKVPGKYFAIARCYRPDVIDAKHLAEFNQVEGIIVQENLTLKNLLHILELFAREICNVKEIKFVPHYFPFTEPSVELHAKHPKFGWVELGGAGIFRREVTMPLFGNDVTVLAWGLGIDRLAMYKMGVEDIRELFSYDINFLRG
jgi:phenylalanyl-tRNA synthetase alpha chain